MFPTKGHFTLKFMGHKTFTMATESDHITTKFKEGFSILSIFKLPLGKINKEVILINWYF